MKIQAINRIEYDGKTIDPDEEFECRKDEAERLIGLGVARQLQAKQEVVMPPGGDEGGDAALIEKIRSAASIEEILELVPEEASQEVLDAIRVKTEELQVNSNE